MRSELQALEQLQVNLLDSVNFPEKILEKKVKSVPAVPPLTTNIHSPTLTDAVHAGTCKQSSYGPLTLELVKSTNFVFGSTSDIDRFYSGELPFEYGRYGSPTVNSCEKRVAGLEGAEEALLFSSGMAAFTTTLFALLKSGDHVIIGDDSYRRLRQFCVETLARYNISCSVVPMGDYSALEAAITLSTKVIVTETPTNPFLRVVDVERLVKIAKSHNVLTLLDATFATPYVLRPLNYGVDLVVHSATKFLGGHNDLLCGVVAGREELLSAIREERNMLGGIADPDTAWRLERSLKTLALRISRQNETALKLARYLESQPLIEKVWYPLLESHPDHAIALKQLNGGGGVVTFTVKGDCKATCEFLDKLTIPQLADSLGGTESLVKHVALMSYYRYTTKERLARGITDNLVRYSVGLEDPIDLIEDLRQALAVNNVEI
jgi:cystathionine gamma-synthase